MAIVAEQQGTLGVAPVCRALAVPRATYYRWRKPTERVPAVRRVPRALPPSESSLDQTALRSVPV
jgi:putative transposase